MTTQNRTRVGYYRKRKLRKLDNALETLEAWIAECLGQHTSREHRLPTKINVTKSDKVRNHKRPQKLLVKIKLNFVDLLRILFEIHYYLSTTNISPLIKKITSPFVLHFSFQLTNLCVLSTYIKLFISYN